MLMLLLGVGDGIAWQGTKTLFPMQVFEHSVIFELTMSYHKLFESFGFELRMLLAKEFPTSFDFANLIEEILRSHGVRLWYAL